MCTTWWLLLVLFHCLPVTLPGFQVPESPGTRLKREGLTALPSSCFGAWHRHWRARAVGGQALCRRSFSKATLGWQIH
uniref:Uncharacterized protein n=1 Tax=Populus trichocarpa TaxID=3694 RepID=A0A2K1Z879_POPTR